MKRGGARVWWESRIVPKRRTRLGFHAVGDPRGGENPDVCRSGGRAGQRVDLYRAARAVTAVTPFRTTTTRPGFGPRKINRERIRAGVVQGLRPLHPVSEPDGYWYRIASSPWDDNYYSPPLTHFGTAISPGTPLTHQHHWAVPIAVRRRAPPPPPPPPPTPTPRALFAAEDLQRRSGIGTRFHSMVSVAARLSQSPASTA